MKKRAVHSSNSKELWHEKGEFNIAWISTIVIFIGAIIYPVMLEHADRVSNDRAFVDLPTIILPPTTSTDLEKPEDSSIQKPALFERNLKIGDSGEDVKRLQEYLNANGFVITASGPGSPGHETELFGRGTKSALTKFQETYAEIILAPRGLSTGTGDLDKSTRDFINS